MIPGFHLFNEAMPETTNHECPDYTAHQQNAAERLIPGWTPDTLLTADQDEAVTAEAEAEYRACEGHC